jgi:hypothetical protein
MLTTLTPLIAAIIVGASNRPIETGGFLVVFSPGLFALWTGARPFAG